MKQRLLQYLACTACRGTLGLRSVAAREGDEVLDGTLQCVSCGKEFPLLRGVPRFADLSTIHAEKSETASKFGWQWSHFTQDDKRYEEQFLGWIAPVPRQFFSNKVVLEGGCGKGRHTELASRWGARDVIGIDLSAAVETAFAKTRGLKNAHIIQADIYNLPFERIFDYAFSIGVLHHLPDPRAGFVALASKVKSGGWVSAWVYGAENNEWITRWVNPVRQGLASRMQPQALLQLSKLPTALLYAGTKLLYGPANRFLKNSALTRHLFYNDYLRAISSFGWREHHTIVFDHLVAPTAFYISRSEFERWWRDIGVTDAVIGWHNKNSWRGWGRLSSPPIDSL